MIEFPDSEELHPVSVRGADTNSFWKNINKILNDNGWKSINSRDQGEGWKVAEDIGKRARIKLGKPNKREPAKRGFADFDAVWEVDNSAGPTEVKDDTVIPPEMYNETDLLELPRKWLQRYCRNYGLPIDGDLTALVGRLMQHKKNL